MTASFSPSERHASARSIWVVRRSASSRVASAPAIRPVVLPSSAGPRHASRALPRLGGRLRGLPLQRRMGLAHRQLEPTRIDLAGARDQPVGRPLGLDAARQETA